MQYGSRRSQAVTEQRRNFMDIYAIVWLAAAVVFLVIEGLSTQLVTIWLAGGALVSMVLALCRAPFLAQILVFALVSLVLLILTRPFVKRFMDKKTEATNADRCIGREAVVTDEIDNINGRGAVKLAGQPWTARSSDNAVISVGETVTVERIEGVKLIVSRKI